MDAAPEANVICWIPFHLETVGVWKVAFVTIGRPEVDEHR